MSTTPLWRRYLRFWGSDPGADVDDEFASVRVAAVWIANFRGADGHGNEP